MNSQLGHSRTVFVIEQEPLISMWITEVLADQGVATLRQAGLADVIKAAKAHAPAAVILDLASADTGVDPNARMGPDHLISVLRQTYPGLCVVALAGHTNTETQTMLREFRVPLLTKPFGSAELLKLLRDHGVVVAAGRSP